jgi:hypothetical protein
MAKVKCAISGMELKVSYVPMTLQQQELAHPIFYLSHKQLHRLYQTYTAGKLDRNSSYLLFLALLHATDHVDFRTYVRYTPFTDSIIAHQIDRLVKVWWQSDSIINPQFRQPRFAITSETANLSNVKEWINAWQTNLALFNMNYARKIEQEKLQVVQDKLTATIYRGTHDVRLASIVAKWADMAGRFPEAKRELWMKTIRSCFNSTKMFATPKTLLLEIREHCENNIEVGSIHFHKLMEVLTEGLNRHTDFLGLEDLSTIPTDFTLLPSDASRNTIELSRIISEAPKERPKRNDFSSQLAYLQSLAKYQSRS